MLLKRQEKDNVIKAIYKSSNLLASTYNKETSELILVFNKGTQYKYAGVKSSDYTRLELAESQGSVFNTHIKPYSFEKMADMDPTILPQIVSEVEDLFTKEQKSIILAKSNKLRTHMLSICAVGSDVPLSVLQLEELQVKITAYISDLSK
jgi:hypothetical protein